ncbi:Fur family transcriptional regulator [Maledivibacter halophilus]|uniref:Fur family transcriptional regulator, peroxide stress response regulator n=1 Tax=Maledivibacter halophilus TaxID=36842 RepID=A0A1T5IQI7_9FIRM|nr:Fur family transcriptional regulator [Maledivibacter halophilus]SKC41203.1 Fur family transcriptional regulator, peroxide stress response regulator [Maledivibacter halophilus]
MEIKVNEIDEYLKRNDIKPSYQRIKIFHYLMKYRNHPTVDMIYQELVKEIPTLSKTTVYNTLKLFIEKKIVSLINIEDNETRYDADTSFHGHFKCRKCNEVYDIKTNMPIIEELDDFNVEEYHLYIKGICKKCVKR